MDRYDVIAGLGLALLAAGLVWVWWPLALMVPGVILLVVGLAGAVFGSRGTVVPRERESRRRG